MGCAIVNIHYRARRNLVRIRSMCTGQRWTIGYKRPILPQVQRFYRLAKKLDCLIVQQPYASLIASGFKRWEFRGYETKKTGEIGIAASNSQPLQTKNLELNRIRYLLPTGVV